MSPMQSFGAAMTFAKRYAFCNAFGILTADEDRDGQGPAPKGLKAKLREAKEAANPAPQSPNPAPQAPNPPVEPAKPSKSLKSRLWDLLHEHYDTVPEAESWLRARFILRDGETLGTLSQKQLETVYEKATIELSGDLSDA